VSRKRRKTSSRTAAAEATSPSETESNVVETAIPDEILAEGSGPHADPADLAAPASEPVSASETEAEPVVVEAALADVMGDPSFDRSGDVVDEVAMLDSASTLLESEPDAEVLEADAAIEGEGGAELPVDTAAIDARELKNLIEALIFAADKPVTLQRLRQLSRVADVRRLEAVLAELAEDYRERGLALQCISGGYQFRTATRYSSWVQQLIAGRPVRLSRAQLETLAIIAYRQPITRPEIDDIRGVDSSATLKLLLDRSLIRILGKREEVGRPMLYGTTKEFLDFFSLDDLRQLPTLREYSELSDESRQVMSDRLGIEPEATPRTLEALEGDAGRGEPDDVDVRFEGEGEAPIVAPTDPLDVMAAWAAEDAVVEAAVVVDSAAIEEVVTIAEAPVEPASSDELYTRAVALVQSSGRASVMWVQRQLRIGYSRAAALVDELAAKGVLDGLAPPTDEPDDPVEPIVEIHTDAIEAEVTIAEADSVGSIEDLASKYAARDTMDASELVAAAADMLGDGEEDPVDVERAQHHAAGELVATDDVVDRGSELADSDADHGD